MRNGELSDHVVSVARDIQLSFNSQGCVARCWTCVQLAVVILSKTSDYWLCCMCISLWFRGHLRACCRALQRPSRITVACDIQLSLISRGCVASSGEEEEDSNIASLFEPQVTRAGRQRRTPKHFIDYIFKYALILHGTPLTNGRYFMKMSTIWYVSLPDGTLGWWSGTALLSLCTRAKPGSATLSDTCRLWNVHWHH